MKMSPKNSNDKTCKASGAGFSSYRLQATSDLRNFVVTTEHIMSAQTGNSQKKVDKIKDQDAKKRKSSGKKQIP
jgi:hypothetical protein